jgi:hypothetical protein
MWGSGCATAMKISTLSYLGLGLGLVVRVSGKG